MLGVILTLLILPLAAAVACALLPGPAGRPGRHRNVAAWPASAWSSRSSRPRPATI